jgi:hypothetical protein
MSKKKKSKRHSDRKHPTLFAHKGAIRYYKDGSMLSLYSQLSMEEWEDIVEETIKYKVFLECLKEVAFPQLEEPWVPDDEYFKLQLEIAVSRMRNIDALLVAKFSQEEMKTKYVKMMEVGVEDMKSMIEDVKKARADTLKITSSDL